MREKNLVKVNDDKMMGRKWGGGNRGNDEKMMAFGWVKLCLITQSGRCVRTQD